MQRLITIVLVILLTACSNKEQQIQHLLNMVHHNPGEPLWTTKYLQPGYLKELNYTGQVPVLFPQCGLTYDKTYPGLVPDPSDERRWIDRNAKRLRLEIRKARDAGISIYASTDILVVPKSLMEKFGDEMKIDGRLSIRRNRTQEVIRAQVEELFFVYPDLDGLVTRFGETYTHDTPFHVGDSPLVRAHLDATWSVEDNKILLEILREEICVKRNKVLIYRTWDFEGIHAQPELYLSLTNSIEPHPNLFFSMKHIGSDYIRNKSCNLTIGTGSHKQIVEVSMNQAGLYGRYAHPYYPAIGIIYGYEEMQEPRGLYDYLVMDQVAGVWIWCWGDGWAGPYIDNELWNDLNEYVVRQFSLNPELTEEELFRQYVKKVLELDNDDIIKFRKLLLLSNEATYLLNQSRYGLVDNWWCRDHYITGRLNVDELVRNGKTQDVIAEKDKSVKLWEQIIELSQQIELPDKRDTRFLRVSCQYGLCKARVFREVWRLQLLQAEEKINNVPLDFKTVRVSIDTYEAAFEDWRQLKRDNPSCATIYVDDYHVHSRPYFRKIINQLENRLLTIPDMSD